MTLYESTGMNLAFSTTVAPDQAAQLQGLADKVSEDSEILISGFMFVGVVLTLFAAVRFVLKVFLD